MNLTNPIEPVARAWFDCLNNQRLTSVKYRSKDFKAIEADRAKGMKITDYTPYETFEERPHPEHEMFIHAMFPQMWNSTALGFGGLGGQAITSAYTTIIGSAIYRKEFAVYFNGRFAYRVDNPSDQFFTDINNRQMKSVMDSTAYQTEEQNES